jgi:hypothetical protein
MSGWPVSPRVRPPGSWMTSARRYRGRGACARTSIFPDTVSFEARRVGSGDEFEVAGALDRARCEDEAGFVVLYRHLQPRLVRYPAVLGVVMMPTTSPLY